MGELQARWRTVFGRRAPPHLPRHLLFRMLAYRLQADRLGELDADSRRLLDRIGSGSSEGINRLVADFNRPRTELRPGTLLTREWDGHLQRVMVLADGFSWNGKTYPSLSKVAFAMTGTCWSGPRFFGLDKPHRNGVELFDGHGVSFVSVTQQLNTTTSMGQLTLNVLLSFASSLA
jgi:hypothetical protein